MRLPSCKTSGIALALAGALTVGLANADRADADDGGYRLETSRHGVVKFSDFPHCANEDGSGSTLPCTWNVGSPDDGNGQGLAFIVVRVLGHKEFDYVWPTSPVGHGWHWVRSNDRELTRYSDCVVKAGKGYERCPDGHHDLGH